MSLREKYLKVLSGIIPVGAVGASLLLGSTVPSAANEHPTGSQTSASDEVRISERLAAIREAVSAVAQPESGRRAVALRGELHAERDGPQNLWAARDKCGNRPSSTVRGICQVFGRIP
jgi:hypothetical protein